MTAAPWAAVIGSGRSGTAYTAQVASAAGLNWGHEQWWYPDDAVYRDPYKRPTPNLDGDSSWMALPSIEAGDWSGITIHIIRQPIEVVRSMVGMRMWTRDTPWRRFALRHCPEVSDAGTAVDMACVWWQAWNVRCAAVADVTVRVEDIAELVDVYRHLLRVDIDVGRADRLAEARINHRRRAAGVPARDVWERCGDVARRFGYRITPTT